MGGHKLGSSVYARVEHRKSRSALLSPSITVTVWSTLMNCISDHHWLGDSRHWGILVVPLNKIALLHYLNRSSEWHHTFSLPGGAVLHVTWTELSETDALFHTFYTGNVDQEYVNEHMNLELHLRQVQSMVSSFSIREGHTCCRCGDESCMIPTFKHLTNVQGADDAETVKLLMDVMRDFVKRLVRLGCTLHPKTLRIQAIVDDSNIFAGPPCAGSLALPSSSRSSFMPHNSDGVDDPSFCNASLQSTYTLGFLGGTEILRLRSGTFSCLSKIVVRKLALGALTVLSLKIRPSKILFEHSG